MIKVSVLMPIYNVEPFIAEAIDSIFNQTFEDFELIVIDDASTDATVEIVRRFKDRRLKLHLSEENRQHAYRLNQGIAMAQGEYLAIMHGDDIAHPERLARQVEFLDQHPDIGVCGTWYRTFGTQNTVVQHPTDDCSIRLEHLLNNSALGHPTVMLRHWVLKRSGLYYDPERVPAEDYWLWIQLSCITQLANLPEVLLSYRIHSGQISQRKVEKQLQEAQKGRDFFASRVLNRDLTPEEKAANRILCHRRGVGNPKEMSDLNSFINALSQTNKQIRLVDQSLLEQELKQRRQEILKDYVQRYYLFRQRFNLSMLKEFLNDCHYPYRHMPLFQTLKFSTKCLLDYGRN